MKKKQLYTIIVSALVVLAVLFIVSKALPEQTGSASEPDSLGAAGYVSNVPASTISSFESTSDSVCTEDGKPIIRLFSTTWCLHCKWIKPRFDALMQQYINQGKIVAYHWELDTGDDTLTATKETKVPAEEEAIFSKYNPSGGVPTFVFGCKYIRLGNAYERQNDLDAEEAEFRAVIEDLLKSE